MDLNLLWHHQKEFTVLPSKLVTQELPVVIATEGKEKKNRMTLMYSHDT